MFGLQELRKSAEYPRTGFASVTASGRQGQILSVTGREKSACWPGEQNLCASGAGGRGLGTSQLFTCLLEAAPNGCSSLGWP